MRIEICTEKVTFTRIMFAKSHHLLPYFLQFYTNVEYMFTINRFKTRNLITFFSENIRKTEGSMKKLQWNEETKM